MGVPYNIKEYPLAGKTIMLTPGHDCMKKNPKTGKYFYDAGAQARLNGKMIQEKDLNAKFTKELAENLTHLGAKVVYVDKQTKEKVQTIENTLKPDAFITIHNDYKGSRLNSGETVYANYAKSSESVKMANYISDRLKDDKTIPNNKVNISKGKAPGLCVLKANGAIPAVLVEMGFMSNKKELKILNSEKYQKKGAQVISEGIQDYFAGEKRKNEQEEFTKKIHSTFKITFPQNKNKTALVK